MINGKVNVVLGFYNNNNNINNNNNSLTWR